MLLWDRLLDNCGVVVVIMKAIKPLKWGLLDWDYEMRRRKNSSEGGELQIGQSIISSGLI